MQTITEIIHKAAMTISDHGNAAISKSLQYFGIGGSSIGGATWYASGKSQPVVQAVEEGLALSDWGAIVGIIGGITLILKNGVDMYFAHKRNGREQAAHERSKDDDIHS